MNRITRMVVGLSLTLPLLAALPGVVAASSSANVASTPAAMAATSPFGGAVNIPASFTIVPPWGDNVTHKITGGYGTKLHLNTNQPLRVNDYYALDFDFALDEAVYPVAGGTVIFAGLATASGWETYGNLVYIDHGNGFKSIYAHLNSLLVKTGQPVTTGTKLGGAGHTGGWPANDVHLHFALYYKSLAAHAQPLPYGGVAAVPEPFSRCTKNGSGACGNLVAGDQLRRGGAAPSCGVPSGIFCAAYYNNQGLSGNPTFVQNESSINHNWGNGGPGNGVGNDHFSVRWQGSFGFSAANYTFTYSSDDGMRIWIDGSLIVDQWSDQGPSTRTRTVNVSAGNHTVKVEYYENGGGAVAQVRWAATPVTVPNAPSSASASATNSSTIHVTWSDNSGNETGFRISDNLTTVTVGAGATSYNWTGLAGGTYKCTHVQAYNSAGSSAWTSWGCATTPSAASASQMTSPASGSQLGGSSVSFQWSGGTAVSAHWLFVGTSSGAADLYNSNQLAGSQTSQSVSNLPSDGRTLYVRLWSYLPDGWHCYDYTYKAAQASVTVPNAPSNASASATNSSTIHVTWSDNSGNETGFRISDNLTTVTVGAGATSYNWTGLAGGTYKCTHVQAYNSAGSSAWTSWGCATTPSAGYGDVVVDDQSGGFARAGTSSYWHEYGGGYNGHFWWTYTNTSGVNNRAMWTPNLPGTGHWEVYVFVPSPCGTTTNARYRVDHQGVQTTVSINQNVYSNAWVSLGTYTFNAGTGGDVFLGDETYEGGTHQIAFDAVKWVWRGA